MIEIPARALARLLQLASPALPVGAYSYSQGLEWAVECGTVRDADSAARWIGGALHSNLACFDAPLCWRMVQAWRRSDTVAVERWNEIYVAARETAELRAETLQMGYSLKGLLAELEAFPAAYRDALAAIEPLSFPAAFTCAAAAWDIPSRATVTGYLWAWLENQVLATLKAVPLGQMAGQTLLVKLGDGLEAVAEQAIERPDDELSNFSPALAIASSRHETQYSRLFRS